MRWVMNDDDMNRMLEEIRPEGENYAGKAWGTIMAGIAKVLALGALSNVYCYLGVTEHFLVIAVLGSMDIERIHGKIYLPLDEIEKVSIRHGWFPSQRIIKIQGNDVKMKISLLNNTITAKVKDQKHGMAVICDTLGKLQQK